MYASSGRSTSGSMSLRVRSVSGRSLVPCPPTKITAGRLIRRAADALVDEPERAHLLGIEQVRARPR